MKWWSIGNVLIQVDRELLIPQSEISRTCHPFPFRIRIPNRRIGYWPAGE